MPKEAEKSVLAEIRPGFIPIFGIEGVDESELTYSRPDKIPQPKQSLRKIVLKSLASAAGPHQVPPIEVWMDDDGKVYVLDGDHRVINALAKVKEGDATWSKIRVSKNPARTLIEAQIYAAAANPSAGALSEVEQIGAIHWLIERGIDTEIIIEKFGRGINKTVSKIEAVMNATPKVLRAVLAGDIDLLTGESIAKDKAPSEQSEAVDKATQAGGGREGRKAAGTDRKRTRGMPVADMLALAMDLYEGIKEGGADPYAQGQWDNMMKVLLWADKSYEDQSALLQDMIDTRDRPKSKGGRPKK